MFRKPFAPVENELGWMPPPEAARILTELVARGHAPTFRSAADGVMLQGVAQIEDRLLAERRDYPGRPHSLGVRERLKEARPLRGWHTPGFYFAPEAPKLALAAFWTRSGYAWAGLAPKTPWRALGTFSAHQAGDSSVTTFITQDAQVYVLSELRGWLWTPADELGNYVGW